MQTRISPKGDQYVLNYAAKFLARTAWDSRHDFCNSSPGDPRGHYLEGWRFPIIDSFGKDPDPSAAYAYNQVTFVYPAFGGIPPAGISVVGSFLEDPSPVPLRRIGDSHYFTESFRVPKGQVHTYKFLVEGKPVLDPVNPQVAEMDNGRQWSRFFTHFCSYPVTFEAWELRILERLTNHILPFRTRDGENFLRRFNPPPGGNAEHARVWGAYHLDQPVGAANFIDKVLAREERHNLDDYRVCLRQIDHILRWRKPRVEPARMPQEMYAELYGEMGRGRVDGWDYLLYQDPAHFLKLLRRHTLTGAFSHPKYGGNAGAIGWCYLEDRYRDDQGETLFAWRRAVEAPLGGDSAYRG